MLYKTHQHYIINILEPLLKDHANEYNLDQIAYEMLLWYPGDNTTPAGWYEDSTEHLADVLERNTID